MHSYDNRRNGEDPFLSERGSVAPLTLAAALLKAAFYRFTASQGNGTVLEIGAATPADRE